LGCLMLLAIPILMLGRCVSGKSSSGHSMNRPGADSQRPESGAVYQVPNAKVAQRNSGGWASFDREPAVITRELQGHIELEKEFRRQASESQAPRK
jgi:hypothetical protein